MELRAYHLQTKRVSGLNSDLTPKIEDITVKLVGEIGFEKYCKILPVRGFVKADPPKIIKVLERKGGKWSELGQAEINEAQKRVDVFLNADKVKEKVNYKAEFNDQKKTIDALKERLEALESKPKPGPKKKVESKPKDNE